MNKPTKAQIFALQVDAGTHGDTALVETCELALDGDEGALIDVARVLNDAVEAAGSVIVQATGRAPRRGAK